MKKIYNFKDCMIPKIIDQNIIDKSIVELDLKDYKLEKKHLQITF